MALNKLKALKLIKLLNLSIKNPETSLKYRNQFTLLTSVVLSAQCTDTNVNNVTKNIYDTLEQGQLTTKAKDKEKDKPITLKKQAHIVKLFGSPREENLSVEIDELACDNDEIKSIRSDSSNSLMDIDVVCVQTQHSL